VGGVFIHEKYHQDVSIPRFAGWWGYDKATRFNMEKGFKPVLSAEGWQLSTPAIFLYASHKAALDIFEEAGMERLEAKRKMLTAYLWFLLNELNSNLSSKVMEIITPSIEAERGCQVSLLMLKDGKKIYDELKKAGVMLDWREPNVIRLAPVPLYNSFEEVGRFIGVLK
jgi:kynureninase